MSKTDQWMPLYIADYAGDTLHLKRADHGSYLLLLMHYWRNGPLPNDPEMLADIAGMTMEEWEGLSGRKVRAFFTLGEDGLLHQKRIDRELARCAEVSAKRSALGKKGVEAREANKRRGAFRAITASATAETVQTEAIAYPGHDAEHDAEHDTATSTPTDKEDSVLRTGASAPDATPTQTSFLPPAPKPEPTPLDILYAAGLPILVKLTGKSADDIRPHLGGLAKIAGPEIVLATLQDCENAPPKGSIYAWIRRCCEAEAKRRGVRLVVDNDPNDHWGIEAWCRSLPGVLPTETDEHRKVGKWLYSGAIVDGLARRIAEITQLPPTWRGDWTLLGEWLAAGHEIDAILEIVAEIAGRVDSIVSLRFFDDRVRRLPRPNLKYLERLQRKSA